MPAIYIHVPFCVKKCDYCDFFSVPLGGDAAPHEAYLAAIVRQLDGDGSLFDRGLVPTIYFGGGTPSLMPPEFFAGVLSAVRSRFELDAAAEVTAEVNPATADGDWFRRARDAGITRVSIGAQSFRPHLLDALGRIHSAGEAMEAVALAQEAGFLGVSVDLMYAIAGESIADLEGDLKKAMAFQTEGISAYALTLEEGTPMHRRACGEAKSGIKLLSEDEGLKQMRVVARTLSRGGWERYEISNFAKPGFECRHNMNYWRYGEYLGLGAGAASFVRPRDFKRSEIGGRGARREDLGSGFARRWTQVRDVAAYISGNGAPAEDEAIDARTAIGEFCFMGLRTVEGISRRRFEELFGVRIDELFSSEIAHLVADGLLESECDRISLTQRGLELANQVFSRFV